MTALYADEEILVGHVILEPGERLPSGGEEVHVAQTETIVMLRGEIVVRADLGFERRHVFAQRPDGRLGFAHIPEGAAHWVQNEAAERAEYLAVLRRVGDADASRGRRDDQ